MSPVDYRCSLQTTAGERNTDEHREAVVGSHGGVGDAAESCTKRGISRLIDSHQDGLLEKQEFEPRVRAARERLSRLEEALRHQMTEDHERRALRVVIGRLQDFADTVNGGLDSADWTTRREIIRAVVKQIEIDEQEVRIMYKITPDGAAPRGAQRSLQDRWRGERTALRRPFCRR